VDVRLAEGSDRGGGDIICRTYELSRFGGKLAVRLGSPQSCASGGFFNVCEVENETAALFHEIVAVFDEAL
jgi:hypothetical protein